jgi:hypothetical protein
MGGVMKTPVLVVIAILTLANAVFAVDPPPDGGYPNFNTAEGDNALFSLTTGSNNTAIGSQALFSNTIGSYNTATGLDALLYNSTGEFNTAFGTNSLSLNNIGNFFGGSRSASSIWFSFGIVIHDTPCCNAA